MKSKGAERDLLLVVSHHIVIRDWAAIPTFSYLYKMSPFNLRRTISVVLDRWDSLRNCTEFRKHSRPEMLWGSILTMRHEGFGSSGSFLREWRSFEVREYLEREVTHFNMGKVG